MTSILDEIGYSAGISRLKRIYEKMYSDANRVYKRENINFKTTWFPVFYVLIKADRPLTIMEIANLIAFSHITVKNILVELDKDGFVNIVPNPDDGRSKLVSLSESGWKLLEEMEASVWEHFYNPLRDVFVAGHPDFMNIIRRIDYEIDTFSMDERMRHPDYEKFWVFDYRPGLKKLFYDLTIPWLLNTTKSELSKEEKYMLNHPDDTYLKKGGFVFFVRNNTAVIGCVALARLNENVFELTNLFVNPNFNDSDAARRLMERCINRCKENEAVELWVQTASNMPMDIQQYTELGFVEKEAPAFLSVSKHEGKIMCAMLCDAYVYKKHFKQKENR